MYRRLTHKHERRSVMTNTWDRCPDTYAVKTELYRNARYSMGGGNKDITIVRDGTRFRGINNNEEAHHHGEK